MDIQLLHITSQCLVAVKKKSWPHFISMLIFIVWWVFLYFWHIEKLSIQTAILCRKYIKINCTMLWHVLVIWLIYCLLKQEKGFSLFLFEPPWSWETQIHMGETLRKMTVYTYFKDSSNSRICLIASYSIYPKKVIKL